MTRIHVREWEGVAIEVETGNGHFYATVDDAEVSAPSYSQLVDQVERILKGLLDVKRKAMKPVQAVFLVHDRKTGLDMLQRAEVCGILANRTYSKGLRVKVNGASDQLEGAEHYCMHPKDEAKIQQGKALCLAVAEAMKQLTIARTNLAEFRKTLVQLHVKDTHSKEEAVAHEPELLAGLQHALDANKG